MDDTWAVRFVARNVGKRKRLLITIILFFLLQSCACAFARVQGSSFKATPRKRAPPIFAGRLAAASIVTFFSFRW